MKTLKHLSFAVIGVALFLATPHSASAQVSVEIGAPPVCPYGYYEEPPYTCAPYGYYGPEWFAGGVFIGAGPWFHGPERFYGHVDHGFDYRHGYHGHFPRGESVRSNIIRSSFAAEPCMTVMAEKLQGGADKLEAPTL